MFYVTYCLLRCMSVLSCSELPIQSSCPNLIARFRNSAYGLEATMVSTKQVPFQPSLISAPVHGPQKQPLECSWNHTCGLVPLHCAWCIFFVRNNVHSGRLLDNNVLYERFVGDILTPPAFRNFLQVLELESLSPRPPKNIRN